MNKRKKLLTQVGILLAIFFIVMLAAVGSIIYMGSTAMFLRAKNEMIDQDLLRVASISEDIPMLSDLLDYWHDHPDDVKRDMTEEEMEKGYTIYNDDFWYTMNTTKFDQLDDYQKLAVSHDYYNYFAGRLNSEQHDYNYYALYCLGVSPDDMGYVYVKANGDMIYDYTTLGGKIDMDISSHRAVQKILSGQNAATEYEIVDNYNGTSVYIGYAPVEVDNKVKCVMCVFYDWSKFHKSMNDNITLMAIIGVIIMFAVFILLLHYLFITAVKPVTLLQSIVREYRENKDSGAAAEKLYAVNSDNELGVLADDISQLAQEMERYTNENIRLAGEKKKAEAELELATNIQKGSLTAQFPKSERFDVYASMTPAKAVGGDFYDVFYMDGDHLALVIADVSGKGVPAALFMMASKIIINMCSVPGSSPADILHSANEKICAYNPIEMFVTVWLGILEISTGKLECSNAGHEFPAVNSDGSFKLFKDKHGFVIGGMSGSKYRNYEIQLNKGDCVFVYTDGVAEASNDKNELFGTDRMLEALNAAPDASPEELLSNVKASVDGFVDKAPQFDDLTMLCIKYN